MRNTNSAISDKFQSPRISYQQDSWQSPMLRALLQSTWHPCSHAAFLTFASFNAEESLCAGSWRMLSDSRRSEARVILICQSGIPTSVYHLTTLLQVLDEQAKGSASCFAPYIKSLPTMSQLQHIPFLAGAAAPSELQYEPAVRMVTAQHQWLESFASTEFQTAQQQCPSLFQGHHQDFAAIGECMTSAR